MKDLIAIVLLISALIILVNKRLAIFSSWVGVEARVLSIKNKLEDRKGELNYEYKIKDEIYNGKLYFDDLQKYNNFKINDKIKVYYHYKNKELSVKSIPTEIDDYILIGLVISGALYLYNFSCESCIAPVEDLKKIGSIPSINELNVNIKSYD